MFSYLREAFTGKTNSENTTFSAKATSSGDTSSIKKPNQTDDSANNSTSNMNGLGRMIGMVPKMFSGGGKSNKKDDIVEELHDLSTKYPYSRPSFLDLVTREEMQLTLQHSERLITLPKRNCLPRDAGYAE